MDKIRLFVGCAPNHEDAESQAVLEYSIRSQTEREVDITWMKLSRTDPNFSGWDTRRWATPFTGFRWAVPHLAGGSGRAIYCDSDFIFMADIGELFDLPFSAGKCVMAKSYARTCCMLFDCEPACRLVPPLNLLKTLPEQHRYMIGRLTKSQTLQPFAVDQNWNCLDGEGKDLFDPTVMAIHYTSMPNQVQLKHALPRLKAAGVEHWFDGKVAPHPRSDLQNLFDGMLKSAAANDCGVDKYCQDALFGNIEKRSVSRARGARVLWN